MNNLKLVCQYGKKSQQKHKNYNLPGFSLYIDFVFPPINRKHYYKMEGSQHSYCNS